MKWNAVEEITPKKTTSRVPYLMKYLDYLAQLEHMQGSVESQGQVTMTGKFKWDKLTPNC